MAASRHRNEHIEDMFLRITLIQYTRARARTHTNTHTHIHTHNGCTMCASIMHACQFVCIHKSSHVCICNSRNVLEILLYSLCLTPSGLPIVTTFPRAWQSQEVLPFAHLMSSVSRELPVQCLQSPENGFEVRYHTHIVWSF
jgi:hypothetical protein